MEVFVDWNCLRLVRSIFKSSAGNFYMHQTAIDMAQAFINLIIYTTSTPKEFFQLWREFTVAGKGSHALPHIIIASNSINIYM